MSFFNSYPPVPELTKDHCAVFYCPSNDSYYLVESYGIRFNFIHNGFSYTGKLLYRSLGDSWVHSEPVFMDDFVCVYSSADIIDYADNSQYIFSSASDTNHIFCNTVSSTSVISDYFRSFLPVVSVVAAACLCFISFRKAWNFCSRCLK